MTKSRIETLDVGDGFTQHLVVLKQYKVTNFTVAVALVTTQPLVEKFHHMKADHHQSLLALADLQVPPNVSMYLLLSTMIRDSSDGYFDEQIWMKVQLG